MTYLRSVSYYVTSNIIRTVPLSPLYVGWVLGRQACRNWFVRIGAQPTYAVIWSCADCNGVNCHCWSFSASRPRTRTILLRSHNRFVNIHFDSSDKLENFEN